MCLAILTIYAMSLAFKNKVHYSFFSFIKETSFYAIKIKKLSLSIIFILVKLYMIWQKSCILNSMSELGLLNN
jgi:hypothetical protein